MKNHEIRIRLRLVSDVSQFVAFLLERSNEVALHIEDWGVGYWITVENVDTVLAKEILENYSE